MKTNKIKKEFFIEIEYNDKTSFNFSVTIEEKPSNIKATLMMITRGTLMASNGKKATAYNNEGFDECSYIKY